MQSRNPVILELACQIIALIEASSLLMKVDHLTIHSKKLYTSEHKRHPHNIQLIYQQIDLKI
jgi:hypothetical protein